MSLVRLESAHAGPVWINPALVAYVGEERQAGQTRRVCEVVFAAKSLDWTEQGQTGEAHASSLAIDVSGRADEIAAKLNAGL